MKRKELQAPFLPVFQARARAKLLHMTMPDAYRDAIVRVINSICLPLCEVANLHKQDIWLKFCKRLISGCKAEMPANSETERILKEYRVTLNQ